MSGEHKGHESLSQGHSSHTTVQKPGQACVLAIDQPLVFTGDKLSPKRCGMQLM